MKYCHSSISLIGIVPALEALSLQKIDQRPIQHLPVRRDRNTPHPQRIHPPRPHHPHVQHHARRQGRPSVPHVDEEAERLAVLVGGIEERVRGPHLSVGAWGEKLAGGERIGEELHHRAPLAAVTLVGGTELAVMELYEGDLVAKADLGEGDEEVEVIEDDKARDEIVTGGGVWVWEDGEGGAAIGIILSEASIFNSSSTIISTHDISYSTKTWKSVLLSCNVELSEPNSD